MGVLFTQWPDWGLPRPNGSHLGRQFNERHICIADMFPMWEVLTVFGVGSVPLAQWLNTQPKLIFGKISVIVTLGGGGGG